MSVEEMKEILKRYGINNEEELLEKAQNETIDIGIFAERS